MDLGALITTRQNANTKGLSGFAGPFHCKGDGNACGAVSDGDGAVTLAQSQIMR